LADSVLRPRAERTDHEGVRAEDLAAIADAGLLGLAVRGLRSQAREAAETLSGACLSTWFVAAQHLTPVRLVAGLPPGAALRERLLPGLLAGRPLSGVAFSHLRAHPARPVRAERGRDGGVRFTGTAPYFTGWGLHELALVAGLTDNDEVIFAFLPARAAAGLRPSPPAALAALSGTSTVSVDLFEAYAGPEEVVTTLAWADWERHDRSETSNASPMAFGLTAEILGDLGRGGQADSAALFAEQLDALRREAYELADTAAPGEALAERTALRAAGLELLVRASAALVVSSGGRGMTRDRRPQRLAREAMFLTVAAGTPPLQHALLDLLTDRARHDRGIRTRPS
jgi:alkylation response protein AidB-like acyl-CoA dehydrogenase